MPVVMDKPFILTVDSSKKGVGAILSQHDDQGIEHPCAYGSRSLGKSEENHPSYRLEAAGILWACKHFKPYLVGKEFTIRTDHKPLLGLNRVDGQVLERIRAEMEEFLPYKMEYIKGSLMPADGLSRVGSLNSLEVVLGLNWEKVFNLQKQDKEVKALACWKKYKKRAMDLSLRALIDKYEGQIVEKNGVLGIGKPFKVYAPVSIRSSLLRLAHDSPLAGHQGIEKTLE